MGDLLSSEIFDNFSFMVTKAFSVSMSSSLMRATSPWDSASRPSNDLISPCRAGPHLLGIIISACLQSSGEFLSCAIFEGLAILFRLS